jgi:hypothetical protein
VRVLGVTNRENYVALLDQYKRSLITSAHPSDVRLVKHKTRKKKNNGSILESS